MCVHTLHTFVYHLIAEFLHQTQVPEDKKCVYFIPREKHKVEALCVLSEQMNKYL